MSSKSSPPPISAEEKALMREQTVALQESRDILKKAQFEQDAILEFTLGQQGVTPIRDEDGRIVSFKSAPDSVFNQRLQVEQAFNEQTLKALRGELPISPTLERQLQREEATLNEALQRQLGPGFATSTPGQQQLLDFAQRKVEILENARRGDLSLSESLGLARSNSNAGFTTNFQGNTLNPNLVLSEAFGNVARGFGAATQPFQLSRQLGTQASIANSQSSSNLLSGVVQGGAGIAGVGLAAFLV